MRARPSRYTHVAIALHWVIAVCIMSMIPMGLWMRDAISHPDTQALAYRVFQFHKSIGFLILALTLFRIVWRLLHPVPPLPAGMKSWEGFAARATHAAFYGLMLALPLSGWLYVSSGWTAGSDRALMVPTSWFGLFGVPHLPWIGEASAALRRSVAFQSMGAHAMLAWTAVVLIALHIGAALKHQFIARDGVLSHMIPVLDHGNADVAAPTTMRQRCLDWCAGFGLVIVIAVAAAIAATPLPLQPRNQVAVNAPADGSASVKRGADQTLATNGAVQVDPATRGATGAPVAAEAAGGPAPNANLAQAWTIDLPASSVGFTGSSSGNPFTGQFKKWRGEVWFDVANLAGSRASIRIDTTSATTGDATQEGAMEGEEWLDFKGFPEARFEAVNFRSLGGDRFEATGDLTIKNVTLPVALPFTFVERDGVAKVTGRARIDRGAFNIGMQSDADGAWVSPAIEVVIDLTARRRP